MMSVLWKLWKWFLHLITGQCELLRISQAHKPINQKISVIAASLKSSKHKDLSVLWSSLGASVGVDDAITTIIRVKAIKSPHQSQLRSGITPCLVRVCGVRELFAAVEKLRAEPYQQTLQHHEDKLMQLWNNLMVGCELRSRVSKQWQDLGFQGNNPATDFRGMGLLGLQTLLYFSIEHSDKARSVLLHSKHPKYWYPFAVVGIDLTGVLHKWLKEGALDSYLYTRCTQWPPSLSVFMEMFCFVISQFDSYWMTRQPENVMAFPAIKSDFLEQLKSEIVDGTVVMTLKK